MRVTKQGCCLAFQAALYLPPRPQSATPNLVIIQFNHLHARMVTFMVYRAGDVVFSLTLGKVSINKHTDSSLLNNTAEASRGSSDSSLLKRTAEASKGSGDSSQERMGPRRGDEQSGARARTSDRSFKQNKQFFYSCTFYRPCHLPNLSHHYRHF